MVLARRRVDRLPECASDVFETRVAAMNGPISSRPIPSDVIPIGSNRTRTEESTSDGAPHGTATRVRSGNVLSQTKSVIKTAGHGGREPGDSCGDVSEGRMGLAGMVNLTGARATLSASGEGVC